MNSMSQSYFFSTLNKESEKRNVAEGCSRLQNNLSQEPSISISGKNAVNKAELQLMSTLFPKSALFMKDVLPLKSEKHAVNVSLQIALRQIMDIVSKMVALHN